MTTLDERLDKLPKWAQDEFERIRRERDAAVNALRSFKDDQTPAPFSYDDLVCIGEGLRMDGGTGPTHITRYIDTHAITVRHNGVEVAMRIRDDAVEIQATDTGRHSRDVVFVPKSYCQLEILTLEALVARRSDITLTRVRPAQG